VPKLQSLFQHKSQHCFSICLSTVSAFVTAVFQHMFQHCFSICSSTVFQHMLQHCFSICSSTVSAYVPALCFSICSSTVFQHMFQHCVSAYVTHCVSAYVPAILRTTIYNLLHAAVLFKGYRFLLGLRHLCIDLLGPGGSLYWLKHLLLCLSP
jgi:hypothetical protein